MESAINLKHENPKRHANCFSTLFFAWLIKSTRKSIREGLDLSSLTKTLPEDESKRLGDRLERLWLDEVRQKEKTKRKPSLLKVLIKEFMLESFLYGLLFFLQVVVFRILQPLILSNLISLFLQPKNEDTLTNMSITGAALVIDTMLMVFVSHHGAYAQAIIGMRIRTAVSSLLYRKALRLSETSLRKTTAGQIVNLLSNDVNRFDYITISFNFLWIMPFAIVACLYFMWNLIGISCLAGLLSISILTLPVQGYIGKLTSEFRLMVAERTDNRIKLMNEIVSGIQVIKMYVWEKPFEIVVKKVRAAEVQALTKCSYLKGFFLSSIVFIERLTLYLTLVCYVLLGNSVTPDKVFSLAQFFNILQLVMAVQYQTAIAYGAETLVTIKRLEEFLTMEENEGSSIENSQDKAINLEKVNACWEPHNVTLSDLNLFIPYQKHCGVIGPVGSGKSSLLQLLLGELKSTHGRIQIGGEISYASQEPWLFSASVRKNILFGEEFDEERYKSVVKVCDLEKDFNQFAFGDKTIVGERGVSLSGGQRARINLARCIYRKADIYLLDDPLSAVDTHVGKTLFNQCIAGFLKDKTCILVTHQLHFLQQMPLIVVLNKGEIYTKGTYQEISESGMDFLQFLVVDENIAEDKKTLKSVTDENSYTNDTEEDRIDFLNEDQENFKNKSPFKSYIKYSGNFCLVFGLIFCLILGQAFCSGADFFVAFWTNQESIRTNENATPVLELDIGESNSSYYYYDTDSNHTYFDDFYDKVIIGPTVHYLLKENICFIVYTVLIVATVTVTIGRSMYFFKLAMNASKNLHNAMFHCILQAPMRFFDRNQNGKILNRFSKDMGDTDDLLPRVSLEALQILLVMAGILINIIITNSYISIAVVLMAIIFIKMSSWFVISSRNIKHLEGTAKSPVFSHISATLNGISTIRASGLQKLLIKQFDEHQNVHSSAWFLTVSIKVLFGFWLDVICAIFLAILVISFIFLEMYSEVNGSLLGLAISQSLILTGMLQYGMKQVSDVVSTATSIERILHYTQLETEGPFETDKNNKPYSTWPDKGEITFRNVFLKYTIENPPTLKNLNFTIKPKEKIGIVGRTGAGKSSIISALFRLAILDGDVIIDDIRTRRLGLNEFRSKISIIPQQPVLFSASVRYNLDPFNEYKDEKIWSALNEVELKSTITSLDMYISEGGSNFSVGQRQLLCLARAILRNNKILIMDEATANVDPKTDFLIQSAIRRKFCNCTVLTIAHRLNTIMDSDKVMVMEQGELIEFDHPYRLLQNPNGIFSQMVQQTGPKMSTTLRNVAYEAFTQKST